MFKILLFLFPIITQSGNDEIPIVSKFKGGYLLLYTKFKMNVYYAKLNPNGNLLNYSLIDDGKEYSFSPVDTLQGILSYRVLTSLGDVIIGRWIKDSLGNIVLTPEDTLYFPGYDPINNIVWWSEASLITASPITKDVILLNQEYVEDLNVPYVYYLQSLTLFNSNLNYQKYLYAGPPLSFGALLHSDSSFYFVNYVNDSSELRLVEIPFPYDTSFLYKIGVSLSLNTPDTFMRNYLTKSEDDTFVLRMSNFLLFFTKDTVFNIFTLPDTFGFPVYLNNKFYVFYTFSDTLYGLKFNKKGELLKNKKILNDSLIKDPYAIWDKRRFFVVFSYFSNDFDIGGVFVDTSLNVSVEENIRFKNKEKEIKSLIMIKKSNSLKLFSVNGRKVEKIKRGIYFYLDKKRKLKILKIY